jgi:hypothetical protein
VSGAPDKARKKEIAQAWTERVRARGVFAVRCAPSGEVWVAATHNLDTQQNREWFALRSGGHRNKGLQAAWNAHGAEAFAYDIVETITDEDLTPVGLADRLKTRLAHWREALGADLLVG